jgi:hypothetical protein
MGRDKPVAPPRRGRAAVQSFKPCLEALEDRALPALSVTGLSSPGAAAALAKLLAGQGVTISNVTFTGTTGGATASAGSFTGGNGIIGFPTGIILSNGHAVDVVGNSQAFASTDLGLPGDSDLSAIAAGQGFDATVLQFDFVPKGPQVSFQYVFGSEEYNQFVGTQFNDVFGFFLNGKNVALVPGTNTPVTINTINKNVNSQFYIDNDPTDFNGPGPIQTSLNGLTKVLTITANVNPGQINHIKLAIEDVSDANFDSDVFIKAGSFAAPQIPIPVGYKPFRYVFQASTGLYTGNVTVTNVGNAPVGGPIAIAFAEIPPHATLVNATATVGGGNGTPALPAIGIPGVNAIQPFVAIRVPVVFSDPPPPVYLSTFFEGYFVDILTGKAAQGIPGPSA